MHPIGSFGEKGLWFVRDHRLIVGQVGKFDGQPSIRDGVAVSFGVEHHGEGFAPIPLPRKEPVSQPVGHPSFAAVVFHQPVNHLRFGLGGTKAVETQGLAGTVDGNTVFGKATFGL